MSSVAATVAESEAVPTEHEVVVLSSDDESTNAQQVARSVKKGKKRELIVLSSDDESAKDQPVEKSVTGKQNARLDAMSKADAEKLWAKLEESVREVLLDMKEERPLSELEEMASDQSEWNAKLRVQRALRAGHAIHAASLYKVASVIWSDTGAFCTKDHPLHEKIDEMKSIMFSNLTKYSPELPETYPKIKELSLVEGGERGEQLDQGDSHKLIVRNVPFQASSVDLEALFSAFGGLKSVCLPKKVGGFGSHLGFGFVDFSTRDDAAFALGALARSLHLYGRRLVLEWARGEDESEEQKRTASRVAGGQREDRKIKKRKEALEVEEVIEIE